MEKFESQLKVFTDSDDLLPIIEQEILKDLAKQESHRDMILGTGGFIKIRIPLRSQNRGKSGALRVIYFDCPLPERVFLMMIYSKSKLENISEVTKQSLKHIAQELKSWQPRKN